MVNFNDPAVIAKDSAAMVKLWHTVGGLYVWEFFTTLEYEWNVFQGRLPYRWTIWVYSLARVSLLLAVILRFFLMDNTTPINCQVAFTIMLVLSFVSNSASSLLIVLRIIAIWDRNKVIMAAAISVWCVNVGFLIQAAVEIRTVWVNTQLICVGDPRRNDPQYLISMLIADISLLLVMLVGLFRLRRCDSTYGLTQVLWRQAVLWLLLATVAGVPPVVFVFLNLDAPLDVMFTVPSWITMVIAATRMHRLLVDFAYGSTEIFIEHESPKSSNPPVQNTKRPPTPANLLEQMEVAVHVDSQQDRAPHKGDGVSSVDTGEQMYGRLSGDGIVERDV